MLSLIYKRPIYQQQHINMIYKFKAMCNFNHLLLDSAGASVSSEISVSVFRHLRKVKQQPLIWIFNDFIESNCIPGPDHTCSSSLLTPPPPSDSCGLYHQNDILSIQRKRRRVFYIHKQSLHSPSITKKSYL